MTGIKKKKKMTVLDLRKILIMPKMRKNLRPQNLFKFFLDFTLCQTSKSGKK